MDLIKGEIRRKVMLSWLERRIPGLENEKPEQINFDSNDILNISSFKYETAIVNLKNPPFANTEDFHIVVKTSELLNSRKIMNNIIDKFLKEIDENGSIPVHKESPAELHSSIPKMKAYELITYENNTIRLTQKGYNVINSGGLENWLNMQHKRSEEQIIRDESKEFADHNLRFRGIETPVDLFNQINKRLLDFYSESSKSIFLDEIKFQILEKLQNHRDSKHEGKADPNCGWEIKVEKLLFYINQHKETLPLVAHQKVNKNQSERIKVFVSYSRKDIDFLNEIKIHFKPFSDRIEFWDDSKIEPGQKWKTEIENALAETKVGILLVSANFLASDYIAENELPPILNAAEKDGAVILTVILKPCLFEEFNNLNQYQTLNPPNKPIVKMSEVEREEIYVNLVRQTLKVLKSSGTLSDRTIAN